MKLNFGIREPSNRSGSLGSPLNKDTIHLLIDLPSLRLKLSLIHRKTQLIMEKQFSLLLVLVTCFYSEFVSAQIKKSVTIMPFSYSHSAVTAAQAETISKEVAGVISASGRLQVVNRENLKLVDAERELQKGEDFIDGKIVQQGISQGAEMIFVGHILSETSDDGAVVHLSLVDVATTQVVISEVISAKGRQEVAVTRKVDDNMNNLYYTTGSWKTASTLRTAAAVFDIVKSFSGGNSLKKQVEEFIAAHFPLKLGIAQFEEIEKEQVKKLLIFANENSGLKKNGKLQIVEVSEIKNPNGTVGKREIELGEVTIEKFEGDYALCKVIKGGEELLQKQGNKNVYLVSKK